MNQKLLVTLSTAALVAAPFGAARADLILASSTSTPVGIGGTGLGSVNTVLTIQDNGTENGCVARVGGTDQIGVATFGVGGTCTVGANTDVKTGASQTQTRSFGETGITTGTNFGLVFNGNENDDTITLTGLTATFYNDAGLVLHVARYMGGPTTFTNLASGTGNSGFLFVLNAAQTAIVNGFASPTIRVGVAAEFTGASAGNETFFIANTGLATVVPEPSTYVLMGTGLLGLMGVARRRNRA